MLHSVFYKLMSGYDKLWRVMHKVEKIDSLISITEEDYQGPEKEMNDGTWIYPGDRVAVLHFNREAFSSAAKTPREWARSAFRFRRMLEESFCHVAQRMEQEPRFQSIKAFYGISWFPPHGEKVGFMIEKMPDSKRNRMRIFYFKLLLKAFFPALAQRENQRLQSYMFWITQQQLRKHFLPLSEQKTIQQSNGAARLESAPSLSSANNIPEQHHEAQPANTYS